MKLYYESVRSHCLQAYPPALANFACFTYIQALAMACAKVGFTLIQAMSIRSMTAASLENKDSIIHTLHAWTQKLLDSAISTRLQGRRGVRYAGGGSLADF